MVNTKQATIEFIGTGVMGEQMAHNLLSAAYNVHNLTRTKEKAQALLKNGVIWENSVADLTRASNIIITMVGYPDDVEQVYFGREGIIENAHKGTYLIDRSEEHTSELQSRFELV